MKMIDTFFFNFDIRNTNLYLKILSGFCIFNIISLIPDFSSIYSENSYIPPIINKSFLNPYDLTIYWIADFASLYGIPNTIVVIVILGVYFLSLVMMFLGTARVLFSVISLVTHVMLINSSFFFSYGADYFITFSLFLCLLLSINSKFVKSFAIRLLQIQLCIVYFFAGFGKMLGTDWWDGNAIWYVFNNFIVEYPVSIMPVFRSVFIIFSLFTVFLEISYPLFINYARTRKYCLFFVICMHIAIAVMMGLYTFGGIMIILNLIAWERYFPILTDKLNNYVTGYKELKL